MNTRTKDLLTTVGAAVTAGVFGAGVLWGGTRAEITRKLDTSRFVADSIKREERQAARDSTLLKEVRTVKLILCQDRPRDGWCLQ